MKRLLPIILGYLILTLVLTYPAIFHLTDKIIGDGGDSLQFLGFQYLANKQFVAGQIPFGWTNYWRYPVGFDFGNSYDSSLFMIVGIAFYQIINDPIIVYNLSVLLFLFLNGVTSYFFFQKITENDFLGFIGGFIYGFSFYNLARMGGHPNLILTGCFPFFFYALLTLYQRNGDLKSFVLFTMATIAVFMVSLQYLLLLAGALIFLIPIIYLFYKDILKSFLVLLWLRKKYLFYSILFVLVVFLFFNYAKLESFITKSLILPGAEIVSIAPINFFLPNKYLKILTSGLGNTTAEWIERAVFLGYLEIILFLFFLFSKSIGRKFKWFITTIVVVFFLISLGSQNNPTIPLPYNLIFNYLPFRGIIEAARFYIILYMGIAIGIVLFLKAYLKQSKSGQSGFIPPQRDPAISAVNSESRIFLILVIIVFISERITTNFYLSDTLKERKFIEIVAATNSRAVLDLPLFPEWWHGNKYDIYSIYYQKPIVNGYIHWSGNTEQAKYFTDKLKRFECILDPEFVPKVLDAQDVESERDINERMIRDLKGYGITTVVFHKELSLLEYQCQEVVQRINIFLDDPEGRLIKIFEDEDTEVYYLNY